MGTVNLHDLNQYLVISLVGALDRVPDLRELDRPLEPGVYALWSDARQSIVAFVFQTSHWDQARARAWVRAARRRTGVTVRTARSPLRAG